MQAAPKEALTLLQKSGIVTTLLPGTSFCSRIPYASGKTIEDLGCKIALATDYNPGSCQIMNMNKILTLAVLYNGLSPWTALAGATWVPAHSLKLGHDRGALIKDYRADFICHAHNTLESLVASWGEFLPESVWIKGKKV